MWLEENRAQISANSEHWSVVPTEKSSCLLFEYHLLDTGETLGPLLKPRGWAGWCNWLFQQNHTEGRSEACPWEVADGRCYVRIRKGCWIKEGIQHTDAALWKGASIAHRLHFENTNCHSGLGSSVQYCLCPLLYFFIQNSLRKSLSAATWQLQPLGGSEQR